MGSTLSHAGQPPPKRGSNKSEEFEKPWFNSKSRHFFFFLFGLLSPIPTNPAVPFSLSILQCSLFSSYLAIRSLHLLDHLNPEVTKEGIVGHALCFVPLRDTGRFRSGIFDNAAGVAVRTNRDILELEDNVIINKAVFSTGQLPHPSWDHRPGDLLVPCTT